ncbi:hypothetical protein PHYPSEUDO_007108 [Phytophthora pseudosyringae]|uniref:Uncharacterized protein n=1 Tax=Phytophthora pseudosyringae TaxID=221518 RepID=A0A8T1WBD2_9STRA|nr:hypothetical protein PHYPSEUDO_007108 [Phytophthora pseudosyringae]
MSSIQLPSVDTTANWYQYPLPVGNQQSVHVNDAQRCCYPSKRCQNPRVMKRNGELHRLCEYHRTKANVNQRRLEQRRRLRDSEAASSGSRSNPDEELRSQRLSLPNLSSMGTSDLELDVLDEFLSQADIELSPVNAGGNLYFQDLIDSGSDVRMSI